MAWTMKQAPGEGNARISKISLHSRFASQQQTKEMPRGGDALGGSTEAIGTATSRHLKRVYAGQRCDKRWDTYKSGTQIRGTDTGSTCGCGSYTVCSLTLWEALNAAQLQVLSGAPWPFRIRSRGCLMLSISRERIGCHRFGKRRSLENDM